jgi:hypothetical protein
VDGSKQDSRIEQDSKIKVSAGKQQYHASIEKGE